ncbi:hypothetical protein [Bradyrhizobium sp. Ce-3]|uniref:hypothetical protein n=1 Tax=Bradyrhizobium sp. Ce-3 TaxID=2913970 RepID=UPI001FC82050|nr:hypothetical protein [Bradyrhizobium sp. Ce-3]GKQ53092.1 hypothetical protein BRSPCE3_39470 [Bradyrhizobium sp. Ce-3]
MTDTKPSRRIAVIGTGVTGAIRISLFAARGLHAVESNGAQNAETARATVGGGKPAPILGRTSYER